MQGQKNEITSIESDECVEKNVWLLWKKWTLGRMRRMHGANCKLTGNQLLAQKQVLSNRLDSNWQKLVDDPRNRDNRGYFCMRNAQENMMSDLTERQLDKMILHMEAFEFQLREQKLSLQTTSVKPTGRTAKVDQTTQIADRVTDKKIETGECVENNIVLLWNKWALGRMRRTHGADCSLTNNQLLEQKRVLAGHMDANWQAMVDDPRNRDERGLFCMRNAKNHMLSDLSPKQINRMLQHTEAFEIQLREQRLALQQTRGNRLSTFSKQ
jgi:hypothetical protein